jgi:hypothetical protein
MSILLKIGYIKMRIFITKMSCTLIPVLLLVNFNILGSPRQNVNADNISDIYSDSVAITALIQNMYRWYELKSSKGEFIPITSSPNDTIYSGIDWSANDIRMKELAATNFFAKDFLDNYKKIALHIDSEIKQGHSKWFVGDMSPFEPDANPWCNCQDNPDNYWNKLSITDFKSNKDTATFKWTWGDSFYYSVSVKKELGAWKISSLEGFDYKKYAALD